MSYRRAVTNTSTSAFFTSSVAHHCKNPLLSYTKTKLVYEFALWAIAEQLPTPPPALSFTSTSTAHCKNSSFLQLATNHIFSIIIRYHIIPIFIFITTTRNTIYNEPLNQSRVLCAIHVRRNCSRRRRKPSRPQRCYLFDTRWDTFFDDDDDNDDDELFHTASSVSSKYYSRATIIYDALSHLILTCL